MLGRAGAPHERRRSWDASVAHARVGCVLLVLLLLSSSSAASEADEYRAKATFLAAFPNFIDWPDAAFASEKAPFVICVFGGFSFGTSLAELTRGAMAHGRRIEVRWARKEQELPACHILFVSRSETKRYRSILKTVYAAGVLTVGATPDFLAHGGVIAFLVQDDRLQFEVNITAADEAHLTIRASMLVLARHVVRAETATGGAVSHGHSQRD